MCLEERNKSQTLVAACESSAHPLVLFTGLQLFYISLITTEVMELNSIRPRQSKRKTSIAFKDACLKVFVFGKEIFY